MFGLAEGVGADRVETLDGSLVANVAPRLGARITTIVLVLLDNCARTVVAARGLRQKASLRVAAAFEYGLGFALGGLHDVVRKLGLSSREGLLIVGCSGKGYTVLPIGCWARPLGRPVVSLKGSMLLIS